ncbi:toxin-antitoxin system HicB family antitoxin [Lusitaniella coriacea LEGE 07157]|uniref:Toxin-antitoxin system HicB family antitoxin n=1 Tax=Lusitaniella coriacea LEGE 07157 TaxID=945747 RepID=A0A8J7DXX1_9CYAN|nr:toxin-antitoxin system HicB family antitoxin [Lusitaniella coriacea]MBE9117252.1 toxin-antitoxin system HicB family antitoxin [Lusitaniella coriacea LEGE 07157]
MKKKPSSKTISFRIDSRLAAKLHRQALEQRLSLHEYVRELFLDALSQQELRDEVIELRTEVQNVGVEIDELRHDVSVVLYKFLVELAEMEEEAAKGWMARNL